MLEALQELERAVLGFRRTCSAAQLRKVKRQGASLLSSCRKVEVELASLPDREEGAAREEEE